MGRKSIEETIAELEAQLEDAKAAKATKDRQDQVRRNMVVGEVYHAHADDELKAAMHNLLDRHLKDRKDRALFNLE